MQGRSGLDGAGHRGDGRWRLTGLVGGLSFLFCGIAFGQEAPVAAEPGAKPPLRLERLLSSIYEGGRLSWTLRSGARIAWAGDHQVVFTSPRTRSPRQIFAAELNGSTRVIATGSDPAVSADGRWLAYLTPEDDLVVAQLGDGPARTVKTIKRRPDGARGGMNFGGFHAWQAGGRQLVYLSFRGQRAYSGTIDAMQLTQPEVHVFDPVAGTDRVVYAVDQPNLTDPAAWAATAIGGVAMAADGTLFLTEGEGSTQAGMSAYLKEVKDGHVRTIARVGNEAYGRVPIVSPDGRTVTMMVSRDPPFLAYGGTEYRGVIDVASGQVRVLEGPFPVGAAAFWSADGAHAVYACKPGAVADTLCVAGRAPADDRTEAPLDPLAELQAVAISPDGRRTAWLSRDQTDTLRLKVASAPGAASRTLWSDALIPTTDLALGETRVVRWRTDDGLEFQGLLTLPPGYKGGRLPLLVDIHGGPNGGVYIDGAMLMASPLEAQVWAGMGYAYFKADYREGFIVDRSLDVLRLKPGTTIYEVEARDVLAGVDALIDAGVADPERLAAVGHSMGSVTVTSLLMITDRLKAAVAGEGLEDWTIMKGVKDPVGNPADFASRKWSWRADTLEDVRRIATEGSPLYVPEKIKTPVLVIKSNPDPTRIQSGQEFVDAVNQAGGEARLLAFPDDFHVTVREANSRRKAEETVRWINEHLGVATPAL